MASQRQIMANRHNARRSTGPRSRAGKKRSSHNAYRHGLSSTMTSNVASAKLLDTLTRRIAGDTEDARILERARTIAQAELELARIRRVRLALIAREMMPEAIDPPATAPELETARSAEAVRRALPRLLKLERYERRAEASRDRSVRELSRKYTL